MIVYEKRTDGTFVKVAPAQEVLVIRKRGIIRVTIAGSILALILGAGWLSIWKFKREKSTLPPEEGYSPETF